MSTEKNMMAAMAEIGAIRHVVQHAIVLRILEEPEPRLTFAFLDRQLTERSTEPNSAGSDLDPAISDMLAAMTDERIRSLLDDIGLRLEKFQGT